MANDIAGAKLKVATNSCTLADVELCEKGIQQVWRVSDDGEADYLMESYFDEATFSYYYCTSCETDWAINSSQDIKKAWLLVKEHFNGEG